MLSLWSLFWKVGASFLLLVPTLIILKRLQRQSEEDFSTVLEAIAGNIEKRRGAIRSLQTRQQRFTKLLVQYALAFWLIYAFLWYFGALPVGFDRRLRGLSKTVQLIPLAFEPIVCIFLLTSVNTWYTRQGKAEEKNLQLLFKKRNAALAELKARTKFEATNDILRRFGDEQAPLGLKTSPQNRQRPVRPPVPTPMTNGHAAAVASPLQPASVAVGLAIPPVQPVQPFRRHWYDRLADFILGEEADASDSPFHKYALICMKCHSHNGLAKETDFNHLQFSCQKCKFLNPSYSSRFGKLQSSTKQDAEKSVQVEASSPAPIQEVKAEAKLEQTCS